MILSQGLKQVMTSLLLISFATQLLLKEGITILKLESSKYWGNKIVMLYDTQMGREFHQNKQSFTAQILSPRIFFR